MDWMTITEGFLAAAVRVATPLLLAATGETVAQRSGVMNLGLEGVMLTGALAAALGAASIGLHVFGFNHGAIALYEQLGYRRVEETRILDL